MYNNFRENTMNELAEILNELQSELSGLLGNKLDALYLYGSQARGEAASDSDIDVLVILNEDFGYGEMVRLTGYAVSDLSLKYDTLISLVFTTKARLEEESPFLINIRKDAVPLP